MDGFEEGIQMIERIEKVARVKGVEYNVDRAFERKEGYQGSCNKKFAQVLRSAMQKDTGQEGTMPVAYQLEISNRATHSLFYQNGLDLRNLEARIHENG